MNILSLKGKKQLSFIKKPKLSKSMQFSAVVKCLFTFFFLLKSISQMTEGM